MPGTGKEVAAVAIRTRSGDSGATTETVRAVIVDIRLPFLSVVRLMIYLIMATIPAGLFIALCVLGFMGLLSA